MKVLMVTSDRVHCGIAEYSVMLIEAMETVAPEVQFLSTGPGPHLIRTVLAMEPDYDIIHLNHHAALHSQWSPDEIKALQEKGYKVVVTQHDTFETWQIMEDRRFTDFRCADALIIHEPVEGLDGANVYFLRQGVTRRVDVFPVISEGCSRPIVGSCGFPFPWKGFDALARASAAADWALLLLVPQATVEDRERWQALNPNCEIIPQWLPREEIVQRLSQCQATAWLYSGGGSGTSGAIRLGLAARRPLIAYRNRQFRDLAQERLLWANDEEGVYWHLTLLRDFDVSKRDEAIRYVSEIADRDSWANVARKYLEIYKSLLEIKSL